MKREIIEKLKEQKVLEDEMAKRLTTFYNSTENPLVKLFIHWIILDTKKHSDIYQTLIALNSGVIVGDIEKDRMTRELKTHISEELEMLKRGEEIGEEIKDRNTKKLFDIVIDDERRHHQILVELLNIIEKVDEMGREDWHRRLYEVAEAEKRIPRIGRKRYVQRGREAR
ncbi:MAG: hypothetical protein GWO20_20020 [Candidatus Korarchaeota archaeon]|nr:hypothetical protein [Candidatus Korarchaeota archaeon]NIU85518.1 hypothetical protein [Candidatus Thorarchaeota archaeon]NIW53566.1 hypothetical protein [Candidatus Korarchaeota archaeon]